MMQAVYLHKPAILCALGNSTDEVACALFAGEPRPLTRTDQYTPGRVLPLGAVPADLTAFAIADVRENSRNNRLLLAALPQIRAQVEQALDRHPAHRIGIVLGTSTSGIGDAEQAFVERQGDGPLPPWYHYQQQEMGGPARFLARYLRTSGPAITLSTACSSGAKALASARRLIVTGICDVVICGGVDTLCRLTVNGFSALDSVSESTCNPFSRNRNGINIGEAACLFLMSRDSSPVVLAGAGETSDAHHISAPHPEGRGARGAMTSALEDAGLAPGDIGYLNLHGTATPQNDRMESLAVTSIFGDRLPCSSTKPLTGHTLGAAGALEAAFCWLSLTGSGQLPPHWWDGEADPDMPALKLVSPGEDERGTVPRHVLSNSFAFGGNNIALVLSATGEERR
ncbi:beta-ketoacyl-[acyl-carrier-protein] synthase family protein [Marinobacter changyiensis]|uniref:beta-ketoacyl-[acyl-carrier-protein] synthase family protein n=1 Tax=Marinobacter changyiensis TaxID=2604091 RepID=UPI00126587B2|nr:beta-ketoacyl-[acyl-carrier-protein] synthase family protein [Marinobacter changyiensis]